MTDPDPTRFLESAAEARDAMFGAAGETAQEDEAKGERIINALPEGGTPSQEEVDVPGDGSCGVSQTGIAKPDAP